MGLIDRYEVLRRIGRGGAGDVFLARDRLNGGREVALKTLRARVDDVLQAAFEREFLTMAQLSLPGVAQVYDFGVRRARPGQAASPFLTRAYIDGQPLDDAAQGLPVRERIDLFLRVARVIAPLHRAGVVHGDIKPGNAIVDARGRAFLIDFGLSRMRGSERRPDAHGPTGTPGFMAPELLRGAPLGVGGDIYALGVTLWLLLLGQYPHAALGARAMAAKLEGRVPQIPLSCDAELRAALTVAQRALAHDPRDRFPSVDELIVALERLHPAAPSLADAAAPDARAFVLPRPRGHAEPLAQLTAAIAARREQSAIWLLHAPAGGGKTLLLHELKWRLQLGSCLVLELFAARASGARPLVSLLEQLALALGADHPRAGAASALLSELRGGKLDERVATEVLGDLLAQVASEASVVVLVDDLDRADGVLAAVLRSAVHAQSRHGVAVVATAERSGAPAVRELHADHIVEIPKLTTDDVAGLSTEALGPLDASVVAALVEHAQGLPGALVSALYRLSGFTAVTPNDVQRLPPAPAALALTHARLLPVTGPPRCLLQVLSLVGALPEALVPRVLGLLSHADDAAHAAVLAQLESAQLVLRDGGAVMLFDRALRDALRHELTEPGARRAATQLVEADFADQLDPADRARLAVLAELPGAIRALVPQAAASLTQIGAHTAAVELLQALLPHASDEQRRQALLDLARARLALGQDEAALGHARELAEDAGASAQSRAEAEVLAGRALSALGRFDDAVRELGRVGDSVADPQRAKVQRELARIHLRRGDYAAVQQATEVGLACAASDDPVRVELLCSQGMAANYRGDQAGARACHEAALQLARSHGSRRDEANALTYLAIGCQRSGDLVSARDLLSQSLQLARELGDVGSMATYSLNLGAVLFYLGEHDAAAEHYESAAALARRAGRTSALAQARSNLAHLHLYFGLYETARAEIDAVLRDAERVGDKFIAAQATALGADLLARTGQLDSALSQYDDAIARYAKLGQTRELAELHLDAASALLDRGGPVDASAAAARLATAREHVEREQLEDLRMRLELSIARARLENGDAASVVDCLRGLVERARAQHDRELEWAALAALSLAHEQSGSRFGAHRNARLAVEVLEEIALHVPREYREAYWHDPRRRALRERAAESEESDPSTLERSDVHSNAVDLYAQRERLLEIIKRLAREHDLSRLLERITESAVDLSGAERGSVLLVGEDGNLAPEVTRVRLPRADEAHAAFSRSIAEAVLIDGEPIVTVDATADGRLQGYVSVHKLMLRSVACLPICGHTRTLGVLYLEHRRSRGRFSESAVDLLSAFADQAAIAIENAQLIEQAKCQQLELEQTNRELSKAKAELEDALVLRTRQLEDVQRELSRATHHTQGAVRYGMVGRSASMQRVFDAISRLSGNAVPVVICGDSGTGKELVARAIHFDGPRASKPFVAISCGSLPDTLLESELFGHVKGAFSGADRDKRGMIAAASGGTLFLDDVSEMSPRMQVGLLRVLQERSVCRVGGDVEEPVDVRLIAASSRPLAQLVEAGAFREDLFYRLSVVELRLPPLRERRDDIPALCEHFLREFSARESLPRKHLTRAALARLMDRSWPGNVRQLSHVLLQACVMGDATAIDVDALAPNEAQASPPAPPGRESSLPPGPMGPIENIDHHKLAEKQRILAALESCGWNRVRAAASLGMPRRTFYRRLSDYSIL